MPIKQVEPPQAYEILRSNPDAVYVDVRTEGEFAQGHPAGAINIPVVFLKPGAPPQPNDSFLDVARVRDVTVIGNSIGGWIASELTLLAPLKSAESS